MKRLRGVETDEVQLEIGECDCGYHFGVDATFMDQVTDFIFECPSCGKMIDTAEVFPEDEEESKIPVPDPNFQDYFKHYAKCPKCKSRDIEAGSHEYEGDKVWQKVACDSCGFEWVDVYKLHRITNLDGKILAIRKEDSEA